MKNKVYLSGPITGTDDYKERFAKAEKEVKAAYNFKHHNPVKVVNPVKHDGFHFNHSWEWWMKKDIRKLLKCNVICMLDGWQNSKGAVIEHDLAVALGYIVLIPKC